MVVVGLLAPENKTADSIAYWASSLATWLLPPMLANGLYYRRVKAWVEEARTRDPDTTAQLAYLSARGGTSGSVAVAIGVFVVVALIGMIAAIALPAYQDYVTRSKVAEVLVATEPLKEEIAIRWTESNTFSSELDPETLRAVRDVAYIRDVHVNRDNGTITVTFGAIDSRLDGKSIEWVPAVDADQRLRWTCRAIDAMPARLLPAACRGQLL